MLKALLLQRLCGLSDPQLEEARLDRLSFRRFCELTAHGLARARCPTLSRNFGDMLAFGIVHNLRRAAALIGA